MFVEACVSCDVACGCFDLNGMKDKRLKRLMSLVARVWRSAVARIGGGSLGSGV